MEGKMDKFMDNAAIFFGKTTNREMFKYRNIMEYVNDGYVLVNPISEKNIREMRINMEDADVEGFDRFLERNWGIKPPKLPKDQSSKPEENKKDAIQVSSEPVNKIKKVKSTSEKKNTLEKSESLEEKRKKLAKKKIAAKKIAEKKKKDNKEK